MAQLHTTVGGTSNLVLYREDILFKLQGVVLVLGSVPFVDWFIVTVLCPACEVLYTLLQNHGCSYYDEDTITGLPQWVWS